MKLILVTALFLIIQNSFATKFSVNKSFTQEQWLATISIGLGIPKTETLKLRDVLKSTFGGQRGGYFKHAFDVHDHKVGENEFSFQLPTKEEINKEFALLTANIERARRRNPQGKQTLMLGLTGHGITDGDEYTFRVNHEETYTGDELLDLIVSTGADNIHLIVQSCQSGHLPNQDLNEFIEVLNAKAKFKAGKHKKTITIVTPANRFINSPVLEWEEILNKAFTKVSDSNKDGIVTYREWKTMVQLISYTHPNYRPTFLYFNEDGTPNDDVIHSDFFSYLFSAGISPQFNEYNLVDNTPFFLTKRGSAILNKKGVLHISEKKNSLAHSQLNSVNSYNRQLFAAVANYNRYTLKKMYPTAPSWAQKIMENFLTADDIYEAQNEYSKQRADIKSQKCVVVLGSR